MRLSTLTGACLAFLSSLKPLPTPTVAALVARSDVCGCLFVTGYFVVWGQEGGAINLHVAIGTESFDTCVIMNRMQVKKKQQQKTKFDEAFLHRERERGRETDRQRVFVSSNVSCGLW